MEENGFVNKIAKSEHKATKNAQICCEEKTIIFLSEKFVHLVLWKMLATFAKNSVSDWKIILGLNVNIICLLKKHCCKIILLRGSTVAHCYDICLWIWRSPVQTLIMTKNLLKKKWYGIFEIQNIQYIVCEYIFYADINKNISYLLWNGTDQSLPFRDPSPFTPDRNPLTLSRSERWTTN